MALPIGYCRLNEREIHIDLNSWILMNPKDRFAL